MDIDEAESPVRASKATAPAADLSDDEDMEAAEVTKKRVLRYDDEDEDE